MSWLDWTLVAVAVLIVISPFRYDPAIRLKEWNERKRRNALD